MKTKRERISAVKQLLNPEPESLKVSKYGFYTDGYRNNPLKVTWIAQSEGLSDGTNFLAPDRETTLSIVKTMELMKEDSIFTYYTHEQETTEILTKN